MKVSIISVLIIFLSLLITGCDPTYQVDYKVINNTEKSIKILVDNYGTVSDTNVISTGTTLIFFRDFGIGYTTSDYLDNLETLPFGLSIFDNKGHSYNKSEEDILNWYKFYPQRKSDGGGVVQLTVFQEDFE